MTYSLRVACAFLRRDFSKTGWMAYLLQWSNVLLTVLVLYGVASWLNQEGYFTYSLIGFALGQYVWRGFNAFSGRIRAEQSSGGLEVLWLIPASLGRLILLSGIWDFLFATLNAGIALGAGKVFFGAHLGWVQIFWVLSVGLWMSVAMAYLGLLLFSLSLLGGRVEAFQPLINQMIPILSGAFFPVDILPRWLQLFSYFSPMRYALVIARSTILTTTPHARDQAWVGLVLVTVVLVLISEVALRFAFRIGRTDGQMFSA